MSVREREQQWQAREVLSRLRSAIRGRGRADLAEALADHRAVGVLQGHLTLQASTQARIEECMAAGIYDLPDEILERRSGRVSMRLMALCAVSA